MDGRRRLSRASVEVQTSQLQPTVGTPELVPDPSTVIRIPRSAIVRPPASLPSRLQVPMFAPWPGYRSPERNESEVRSANFQAAAALQGRDCPWSSRITSRAGQSHDGQWANPASRLFLARI